MTSVAFQSILRKQIRKLLKILKSVKIIQYYSILFLRVLRCQRAPDRLRRGAAGGDPARRSGRMRAGPAIRPHGRCRHMATMAFVSGSSHKHNSLMNFD